MKLYLVGGAVRDELLSLPVKERDYVVVGSSPEEMLKKGFKQVGKDFPVFLHPKTKEEYALARQEKKSGRGYHGFEFLAKPNITLKEDLLRRDLTINAIAKDENGKLIDPFNGLSDLKNKKLKHISEAFKEDPLRVLRVARFAARFKYLGFSIADETLKIMKEISESDELNHLTPERVYKELKLALATKNPEVFFEVLRSVNALKTLIPELDNLYNIPQNKEHHPEIDTGIHTMMVLKQSTKLTDDITIRFAALVHDLGKAKTPKAQLPSHKGHEERSVVLVENICKRFKVDNSTKELAIIVAKYHGKLHRIFEMSPEELINFFNQIDAFRRKDRFEKFLIACEADSKGRTGYENIKYKNAKYAKNILNKINSINVKKLIQDNTKKNEISGAHISKLIHQARIKVIEETINN